MCIVACCRTELIKGLAIKLVALKDSFTVLICDTAI